MTPIEIMALVVAVVVLVKLVVLMIKPIKWMGVAEAVYGKPVITIIVSLILAGISLKYLLEVVNIVQIFAVMFFFMFLMALSVSIYAKDLLVLGRKMLKDKNMLKKAWLAFIVWIVLSLWVINEIFALV